MAITISSLEFENVKRIKAVKIKPSDTGLTVIGGDNGQGKTSVLDSIAWALGGDRFRPSEATREGSVIPPYLHITLSNGIVVERKGKNSDLKVIDPEGRKSGQQLLNAFISQFALDLPKFLNAGSREKADILLQIIGVGEQLFELERRETELYNHRHTIGQIADQKEKYAKEMPHYPDAPSEPVSISDLIQQQQEILQRNGENQRKRNELSRLQTEYEDLNRQIIDMTKNLEQMGILREKLLGDLTIAQTSAAELQDESTAELEESIRQVESINIQVRANLDRERAEEDARTMRVQYEELTKGLEDVRKSKRDLLNTADLPLPGLSVANGELLYNGFKWDNMSGSEQLRVGTAIVRRLNPECGFVLLDKLEQMDRKTLDDFGAWLQSEGLQAIATRVSTGEECSVIIEDGYVRQPETPKWEKGKF